MSDAYTKWTIPEVGQPDHAPTSSALHIHRQRKQSMANDSAEEATPEPLTAQAIEDIQQAAYAEGLAQGRSAGAEEGFSQGYSEGYAKGEQEGLSAGLKQGEKEGFDRVNAKADIF